MPWSNIFSAFLFHSNFRSHLGDGWDGQDLASPWCWREEALLPSAPLRACIDSYSSSNSESCSKHLCVRQCHANCPRLCPCVLSPNYSSLQKNCPTQKTAFFVFMLFWDGRRASRRIERREENLGKDRHCYCNYPLQHQYT